MTHTPESQLVILRASRLEALVPPLMTALAAHRPANLLAPQTVIAAHPGMKQWLVGAMARGVGAGGIVANVEVALPSAWLDRTACAALGNAAEGLAGWRRSSLRWAIHAALAPGSSVPGLRDARLTGAPAASRDAPGDAARRRFQLADHLAGVFSQYLIYRPDWLAAWEAGKGRFATATLADEDPASALEQNLLAPLWHHLAQRLGAHRAALTQALARALETRPELAEPLHVFGFSHLAPGEQQVLRAWARCAPVYLYLPDPCREYWGGLSAEANARGMAELRAWRADEAARIQAAGSGDWLDDAQAHPLLARWGRLGQHFYASLPEWEARADIRDHNDRADAAPATLLARVQESVRRLQPDLLFDAQPYPQRTDGESDAALAARRAAWWAPRRADPSLRVHACHTRLRELEVLREALLDAVSAGIAPGDIVVMAPDIAAYAPLLPSVFGAPGDARESWLPWHLADVPVKRSHPLFTTVAQVLDWGESRATLPEVADILAMPDVARALELSASGHDALRGWLAHSRAAWALDAHHRQEAGADAAHAHTLAWALDRLVAGYLVADAPPGEDDRALHLPDGMALLPIGGVQGPDAAALGALDHLAQEWQAWRALAQSERQASAWVEVLRTRFDRLLRIAPGDEPARAAWDALQEAIARIAGDPAQVGEDPLLHFSEVREVLLEALDGVPERQRFLMGGITFCGMVPQRAIPFAMVAVLGLDEGVFPRRRRDGGLDLMARLRRVGDRDPRSDDRWLFLETLMSTRQRLHLSWLGQGARDGAPRNPAAPLAELLSELDRAAGLPFDCADPQARPWRVQHPLQAFDARHFDGSDPALFSHSAALAAMHGGGDGEAPPFLDGEAAAPEPMPEAVGLRELLRYWRRPAENLLHDRLGLKLDGLDAEALPESEPLDGRLAAIDGIAQRVFLGEALPAGFDPDGAARWRSDAPPDWLALGGYLPPGDLGEAAWRAEAEAVTALLDAARERGLDGAPLHAVDVDIALSSAPPLRLGGRIANVAMQGDVWQLVLPFPKPGSAPALRSGDALDLGRRVAVFIQWAALRLVRTAPLPVRPALLADGECALAEHLIAWDTQFCASAADRAAMLDDLRARLARLGALWHAAGAKPPAYFPATSQAALDAWSRQAEKGGSRDDLGAIAFAAKKSFDGGQHGGERDHAPGWNRLLARGLAFEPRPDDPQTRALLEQAVSLESLIFPPLPPDAEAAR
ncbi:exodeoxyribonuclease V subunit gamma [Denitratimonas tolerans]|uniref:RecBCD enzyme subunit RecC n=1 Tax=Denitratimonas tolerans TaxID=1338420 RepID=A0AAW9R642_9GAMM